MSSKAFQDLSTAHGIQLEFTGVSAHSPVGQIEKANGTIRRIFRILAAKHPALTRAMRLRYAIKAINDTAGEKGLVPSTLVFGVTTSLGNSNVNVPEQSKRITDLKQARDEATTIVAEARIRRALKSNLPPSSNFRLRTGQTVMAYSEKKREMDEGINSNACKR